VNGQRGSAGGFNRGAGGQPTVRGGGACRGSRRTRGTSQGVVDDLGVRGAAAGTPTSNVPFLWQAARSLHRQPVELVHSRARGGVHVGRAACCRQRGAIGTNITTTSFLRAVGAVWGIALELSACLASCCCLFTSCTAKRFRHARARARAIFARQSIVGVDEQCPALISASHGTKSARRRNQCSVFGVVFAVVDAAQADRPTWQSTAAGLGGFGRNSASTFTGHPARAAGS